MSLILALRNVLEEEGSANSFSRLHAGENIGSCAIDDADFADAIFESELGGPELGEHATGSDSGIDEELGFVLSEGWDALTCRITDAFDVGQEKETIGVPGTGEAGRHLVGIDVVDIAGAVAADASNDREEAILAESVEDADVGAYGTTDLTEGWVDDHALGEGAIDAAEANGVDTGGDQGCDQFVIDGAGEYLENGVHHLGAGDTEAVDKGGSDAALVEKTSHLFTAAVDDGGVWVRSVEGCELSGEAGAGGRVVE